MSIVIASPAAEIWLPDPVFSASGFIYKHCVFQVDTSYSTKVNVLAKLTVAASCPARLWRTLGHCLNMAGPLDAAAITSNSKIDQEASREEYQAFRDCNDATMRCC